MGGNKKHGFMQWFASWIKTTPAIIISVAAAATVLWGMFTYAIRISPLGEQVSAMSTTQQEFDRRLNEVSGTVTKNAEDANARQNEILKELYIVQILGMIDRNMGNSAARQQILTLYQKIEDLNVDNKYVEYEVKAYIDSLK